MKILTKVILKALSILTMVLQVIFTLGGVAVIIASSMLFLVTGEAKSELYRYVIRPEHLTRGTLLIGGINALVIMICLVIAIHALRQVVNNVYREQFFIAANLRYIRVMLGALLVFTIANVVSLVLFSNGEGRSLSAVFASSWSQIGIYLIFLAVIYTIYLVFKYGVKLQTDSDSVI